MSRVDWSLYAIRGVHAVAFVLCFPLIVLGWLISQATKDR